MKRSVASASKRSISTTVPPYAWIEWHHFTGAEW
jgi:hypothetical protein